LPLSESVRLFADLMSVPVPEDRHPRLSMTAQQQRDATLDAIGRGRPLGQSPDPRADSTVNPA
jgi:hypothetical protein